MKRSNDAPKARKKKSGKTFGPTFSKRTPTEEGSRSSKMVKTPISEPTPLISGLSKS